MNTPTHRVNESDTLMVEYPGGWALFRGLRGAIPWDGVQIVDRGPGQSAWQILINGEWTDQVPFEIRFKPSPSQPQPAPPSETL